jgi:twitching motility protein PilJ
MKQNQVSLFSKMLLWQKFALLSVIATTLVTVPFYLFYSVEQKYINTTIKEQEGLKPMAYMIELLNKVQLYRDLTFVSMSQYEDREIDRKKAKLQVEDQIAKIDKIATAYQYSEFPTVWSEFKNEWAKQALDINSKTLTTDLIWREQSKLAGQILAIKDSILSDSTMDLDPSAETYYLIQVVLVNIPAITEKMAQARHFGFSMALDRGSKLEVISLEDRLKLSGFLGRSQELVDASKTFIERAVRNSPELKNRIYEKTLKSLTLVEQANKIAETEIVVSKTLNDFQTQKYLAKYSKGIDQQFEYIFHGIDLINKEFDGQLYKSRFALYSSMATVLILFFVVAGVAYFISISITRPIDYLVSVMNKLSAGDKQARANLDSFDEVGELGRQFDLMIDHREAVNDQIQRENEALNGSIIVLLRAVAQLAQRDLTVKVPVLEDVTGPVADALNLLSSETAKVLNRVISGANQVSEVSKKVKTHSDNVINVAREEKREVEKTVTELNIASDVMIDIAKLADSCNEAAEKAIQNTDKAQETVLSTVNGITSIRDIIRETEKRIKRLGERSQEIGSVVSIINGIAERTHILALNASMHAASAGEAGRGFAVVANEVQRLAENAREATLQISGLVNNIQVETADTVITMNDAIGQVVQGTALAQQAGNEMSETRETTANLVQLVHRIAANSKTQAETNKSLRARAIQIQKSTEQTFYLLQEQGLLTENLVNYSEGLVKSVDVFILPKSELSISNFESSSRALTI